MALIDVLKEIGIRPDGIIGHSVGELACAYVDGSMTASETLLTSYYRGKCILDNVMTNGSMAAVGLYCFKIHLNLLNPSSKEYVTWMFELAFRHELGRNKGPFARRHL